MPKVSLTDRAVQRLKLPAAGQIDYFDKGHRGLALRLSYGGARSWVYFYRQHGKQRRFTLGSYPAVTLAEAREAWRHAVAAVGRGEDPAADKIAARRRGAAGAASPDSFQAAAITFIKRHAEGRNRTAGEQARILGLKPDPEDPDRLVPTGRPRAPVTEWGARLPAAVTRSDVVRLLDSIVDAGAPVSANRTLSALRKFYSWAKARGLVDASPCDDVSPPAPEQSRDRVLSDDEVRWLLRACETIGQPFGPLVRLLLVTLQRRDEVGSLRWQEIDEGRALWTLPAARSKNDKAHEVPLSEQAVAILATVARIKGCPFVFSTNGKTPVSGFSRAKERLDALMLQQARQEAAAAGEDPEAVTLPPWRLHDLRRTGASGMARLGINLPVIEKLLNHTSGSFGGIVGVYQRHSFSDEKRAALQAWANWLDGLGREPASNVVPMRA